MLGGPEKGEPGPPLPTDQTGPDPFDPLSPARPNSRPPTTSARGVDYRFMALIKNTSSKTITFVEWAYLFIPANPQEGFAYVFTTRVDLPPGKKKNLSDQVPSMVISANQTKAPSSQNRALFKERVVMLRLDYADGSSWHSTAGAVRD